MKKVLIIAALVMGCFTMLRSVQAEVVAVVPYVGVLDYDGDSSKSSKDDGMIYGAYASVGTLAYLVEINYSHLDASYKDSAEEDLKQDDITLAYSKYFERFMFKVGGHYASTNDPILGDGNVIFGTFGGYNFWDKDKFSYGIETYYSSYSDGHNYKYTPTSVDVVQFTPYISLFNTFNKDLKNNIDLKLNYQLTDDYENDSYTSFDVADTIYYKSFFTTFSGYGGKMRSGVKDGGMTVYNTMDLFKTGYGVKVGYYFTPSAILDLSYKIHNYREYDLNDDASSSVLLTSFSYSF